MKVRITVEETLKYTDEIVVEQPNTMDDEEFEEILQRAERSIGYDGSAKDLAYVLKEKYGIKVIIQSDNFPDSPDSSELEIVDVMNVRE
jgi:hypothetical protein